MKKSQDKTRTIESVLLNGKKVAEIHRFVKNPERAFYMKRVNSKKHLMKIYNAYGIQKELFDKHLKEGDKVVIDEKDNERYLVSNVEDWIEYDFVKDHDGEQIFYPVDKMGTFTYKQKEAEEKTK